MALLGVENPSKADDPRPDAAESSGKRPEKPETEFTIVPFVGGNSDMGFGGGYIASIARLDPELQPYRYHIETAGSITVGQDDADELRINYTDIYLLFSFPNLIKDHLGLDVRASYTLESNLKYYGLGNASTIDPNTDPTDSFYEHSRAHPTLRVSFEYRMRPIALAWGASYTQNWFDVPEGTRLANDLESPDPEIRELLGEAETHGTPKLSVGAAWDTRDDETSPTRGLYITEMIDVTPGTFGPVDYRFARFGTAALAGYGVGIRLELLQVPIAFAIGQALVVMVGINVGAGGAARAKRIAYLGAAMAAAFCLVIGSTVALMPRLWVSIFSADPAVLEAGSAYLRTVGPFYPFMGMGIALYFASQGTGEMYWPVAANLTRITIAAGGSLLALDQFGWGVSGLYACVAVGIVAFSALLAFSTTRRAWTGA